MRVLWTREAQQDRLEIWEYLCAESPAAAVKMDELFSRAAVRLSKLPKVGRVGTVPGTRELVLHKSYRLVYEIEAQCIWILALVHTAKQWPSVRE